uniref:Tetrahydrofolate dehydrogenase/cyclohydrolase catalytic domain-containing protein n=1 Tax=Triticum urartu TaxID=4572 RepID=A0A8R7TPV4_TRIUA
MELSNKSRFRRLEVRMNNAHFKHMVIRTIKDIKLPIAEQFRRMKKAVAHVPGLAIVLVGDRRDSQSHVGFKLKGCEEDGIKSLLSELP